VAFRGETAAARRQVAAGTAFFRKNAGNDAGYAGKLLKKRLSSGKEGNDAEYAGKYRKAVLLSEARVTKRCR